jgi:hypothetical protein
MKNSKPILGYGLLTGVAITLFALCYVGIKLKCEALIKDKILATQILNSNQNEELNLTAQFQFLNSEERIIDIAQRELGMVKGPSPSYSLTVSGEKIEQIQKEINSKYE